MEFIKFVASENDKNRRLDRVIKKLFPKQNINFFQATRKNLIKINNKKTTPDYIVQEKDLIQIANFLITDIRNPKKINNETAENKDLYSKLDIIYKDKNILVINKKRGINSQGTNNRENDLSSIIQNEYKKNHSQASSFLPGPIHRLDKNTTGLLIFSQSTEAAQILSNSFSNKKNSIRKTYIGLCEGILKEAVIWENILVEDKNSNQFKTMKAFNKDMNIDNGKLAITKAFPLAHGKFNDIPTSLVKFEIPTGRKHQIRVQSAFNNHPLLGDYAYKGTKILSPSFAKNIFFLHAYKIDFLENELNLPKEIIAPIPEDFLNFLKINLINWNGDL